MNMEGKPNNKTLETSEIDVQNNGGLETETGRSGGVSMDESMDLGLERGKVGTVESEAVGGNPGEMVETAPAKEAQVKSLKDKIMGFFGQAPEQLSAKYSKLGEERMQKNPALRQAYESYLAKDEKVAQKYKEAVGKWKYIARNEKGEFVDKTIYSVASGEVQDD